MLFFDFYVVSRSLLFDWKKTCSRVSAIFKKKKTIMFCVFYFFIDRNDRSVTLRILSLYRLINNSNAENVRCSRKMQYGNYSCNTRDCYTYLLKVNSFEGLTMIHRL